MLGNRPGKFIWYNRKPGEFTRLTRGKRVGGARARGKWLFISLEPGYVLLFGECGGKMLFHPAGTEPPALYHLLLQFDDGSAFTETTQMWGAMELHAQGEECKRQYIADMRTTPDEAAFTFEYFDTLIEQVANIEKTSAKGLLTTNQLIPGIGNASAQDILFAARLHPKHPIDELTRSQRRRLHHAIVETVAQITRRGGRYDEVDLCGHPGGYVRVMDKHALERPCPACGGPVEKIQYLGGACYYCPRCQQ